MSEYAPGPEVETDRLISEVFSECRALEHLYEPSGSISLQVGSPEIKFVDWKVDYEHSEHGGERLTVTIGFERSRNPTRYKLELSPNMATKNTKLKIAGDDFSPKGEHPIEDPADIEFVLEVVRVAHDVKHSAG